MTRTTNPPADHHLGSELGFSMIELLITMLLLSVGIFALAATLDSSRNLTSTAERVQAASSIGEQALEQAVSLPYKNVVMRCNPAGGSPACASAAWGTTGTNALYRGSTGVSDPIVVDAARGNLVTDASGNPVADIPTNWRDARTGARGKIYRFVTCRGSSTATDCHNASGTGAAEKRVTVAVTVTNGPPDRPILFHSLLTDPTLGKTTGVTASPCLGTGVCQ